MMMLGKKGGRKSVCNIDIRMNTEGDTGPAEWSEGVTGDVEEVRTGLENRDCYRSTIGEKKNGDNVEKYEIELK